MASDANNFRYWNREGRWLDFEWTGLELSSTASLRLHSLPRLEPAVKLPPAASGLGALAVAPGGTVFAADAESGNVEMFDPCDGQPWPLPLPEGMKPAGLAASPRHGVLFVADAASDTVRGFDWSSWPEVLAWGGFGDLSDIAAAPDGTLYVVAGGRVYRLTIAGDREPFGDFVAAATAALDGQSVFVRDTSGRIVECSAEGSPIAEVAPGLAGGRALAARGSVYAADGNSIAVFRRHGAEWVRAGEAAGYQGPVASLAIDGDWLWVHPGGAANLVKMETAAGRAREGWLWSKALSTGRTVKWHRLEALVEIPPGAMVDIAYAIADKASPPPADFTSAPWQRPGLGLTDIALHGQEANALWVAIRFLGDGTASPDLRQIRTEHDHEGYLPYLPEIYREPEAVDPLDRLLALYESMFGGVERELEGLAAWLDPSAAREAVLAWLESFLGIESASSLADGTRRERIRNGFRNAARRGTPKALEAAILAETGVRAIIEEPILQTGWWTLEQGALGLETVLAGAEPQGAVAGTTAVLDRSHLVADEDFGAALFDEVAYRFAVRLYSGEVECGSILDRVRAVVEREKPAHTLASFCLIEPQMRIGFQAALGIDSVLGGGEPAPSPLGEKRLVLAGPTAGRVGETMTTGVSTRL